MCSSSDEDEWAAACKHLHEGGGTAQAIGDVLDGRGTAWGGSAVLSGGSLFLPRACWLFGKDGTMSSSSCRKFLHQAVALVVSAMASSQGVTLWRLVAPSRMPRATWSKFRSRGCRSSAIRTCSSPMRISHTLLHLLLPSKKQLSKATTWARNGQRRAWSRKSLKGSWCPRQQQRWRNHRRLHFDRPVQNPIWHLSSTLLLGSLRGSPRAVVQRVDS